MDLFLSFYSDCISIDLQKRLVAGVRMKSIRRTPSILTDFEVTRDFLTTARLVNVVLVNKYLTAEVNVVCHFFKQSGAAGWLTDASQDLDKIVLKNAAILVTDVDLDVSDIEGDDTSLIYLKESRSIRIGNNFDANKYVMDLATLQLAEDSDITLKMWSYIMGRLDVKVLILECQFSQ